VYAWTRSYHNFHFTPNPVIATLAACFGVSSVAARTAGAVCPRVRPLSLAPLMKGGNRWSNVSTKVGSLLEHPTYAHVRVYDFVGSHGFKRAEQPLVRVIVIHPKSAVVIVEEGDHMGTSPALNPDVS
jgi:hypothetical protein